MSWYKSLYYFPDERFEAIPYGCRDFDTIYHGTGTDKGFVRFYANFNSEPVYLIMEDKAENLYPSFIVSDNAYSLADLTGLYKVSLGGRNIFWNKSSVGLRDFPRIEITSNNRIVLIANEIDSWSGLFPDVGSNVTLSYSGKRVNSFVSEYGWSTVDVVCIWAYESSFKLTGSTNGLGAYISGDDKKVFGTPYWSFRGEYCVETKKDTYLDRNTGKVLITLNENGTYVYNSPEVSDGWWESATRLSKSNIGDTTVFKFHKINDKASDQPDIVFVFEGYMNWSISANIVLSEVSLWR